MTVTNTDQTLDLLCISADIVSAHVKYNTIAPDVLPELIRSVYSALKGLVQPAEAGPATQEPQKPAVPVKKSVFPEYIICLEDGHKLKMLKRHLLSSYGLTPNEYRAKWGLPSNYPMVAPNYAAQRSAVAKSIGLGRRSMATPTKPAEEPAQHTPTKNAAKKTKRNTSEADTAAS